MDRGNFEIMEGRHGRHWWSFMGDDTYLMLLVERVLCVLCLERIELDLRYIQDLCILGKCTMDLMKHPPLLLILSMPNFGSDLFQTGQLAPPFPSPSRYPSHGGQNYWDLLDDFKKIDLQCPS